MKKINALPLLLLTAMSVHCNTYASPVVITCDDGPSYSRYFESAWMPEADYLGNYSAIVKKPMGDAILWSRLYTTLAARVPTDTNPHLEFDHAWADDSAHCVYRLNNPEVFQKNSSTPFLDAFTISELEKCVVQANGQTIICEKK